MRAGMQQREICKAGHARECTLGAGTGLRKKSVMAAERKTALRSPTPARLYSP